MNPRKGAHIAHQKVRDGSCRWRVRWWEKGRLHSRTFVKRNDAELFARKVGVIKDAQSVVAASMLKPGKLEDLIPIYVDLVRAKNKPGSAHPDQLRLVLQLSFKRMDVTWTNEVDTNAFDRLVRAHGDHRATLRKAISLIKTFIRWVRRTRFLVDEWALDYQAPRHIPNERISWNEEQVERLLAECDKPNLADNLPSAIGTGRGSPEIMARMVASRDYLTRQAVKPVMWLILRYGPRPIEVSRLNIVNWDPASKVLSFPGKITKTGYPRSFIVDDVTASLLTTASGGRPGNEPLFVTYKDRRWTSHHMTDLINDLIQRAKLPGTVSSDN